MNSQFSRTSKIAHRHARRDNFCFARCWIILDFDQFDGDHLDGFAIEKNERVHSAVPRPSAEGL